MGAEWNYADQVVRDMRDKSKDEILERLRDALLEEYEAKDLAGMIPDRCIHCHEKVRP